MSFEKERLTLMTFAKMVALQIVHCEVILSFRINFTYFTDKRSNSTGAQHDRTGSAFFDGGP